ncbi:MAG: hypothetical protein ABUJ98_15430, partial [Hyphomicrobium sp.]
PNASCEELFRIVPFEAPRGVVFAPGDLAAKSSFPGARNVRVRIFGPTGRWPRALAGVIGGR